MQQAVPPAQKKTLIDIPCGQPTTEEQRTELEETLKEVFDETAPVIIATPCTLRPVPGDETGLCIIDYGGFSSAPSIPIISKAGPHARSSKQQAEYEVEEEDWADLDAFMKEPVPKRKRIPGKSRSPRSSSNEEDDDFDFEI